MPAYDHDPSPYLRQSIRETPYRALEWHVFLETIGSVKGLRVLDLACGDGRLSRLLIDRGAASVVGTDIAPTMIEQARQQQHEDARYAERLRFEVVDARDDAFALEPPVDLVTAMYLLPYASSERDLERMARHVARSLRPGGRFVSYGVNPDYDFARQDPRMEQAFGFRYETVTPPQYTLVLEHFRASFWQWSRAVHEACLQRAGLGNVRWHPLRLPDDRQDLASSVAWYLDNPSLIVLSAEKNVA
jgi:SAM-dependent methyltransferase